MDQKKVGLTPATLAAPPTTPGSLNVLEVTDANGKVWQYDRRPNLEVVLSDDSGVTTSPDSQDAMRFAHLAAARRGEISRLRFTATVCNDLPNKNHVRFRDEFDNFAGTFDGKPFLRDHASDSIANRGGTILKSWAERVGDATVLKQTVEAVKPWAIESILDGTIDRFSIGWNSKKITCSICEKPYFECWDHIPGAHYGPKGRTDDESGELCEVVMEGCTGNEVSAVLMPAVDGTEISTVEFSAGGAAQLTSLSAIKKSLSAERAKGTGEVVLTPPTISPRRTEEMATETTTEVVAAEPAVTDPPAAATPPAPAPAPAEPVAAEPVLAIAPKIRRLLGLEPEATDEDVEAAIDELLDDEGEAAAVPQRVLKALGFKDRVSVTDVCARIMDLGAAKEAAADPAELAKREQEVRFLRAAERVRHYAAQGKFTAHEARVIEGAPAEEQPYVMRQAMTDPKGFEKWATEKAPAVPPARTTPAETTGGFSASGELILSAEDERVLSAMGTTVSRDAFVAERKREITERAARAAQL